VATDREKILLSAQKYVDKKRFDKAIEEYLKIIKQDPEDARTLLKVGDLQSRLSAYADAIATYDRVGQYYAAKGFALKAIAVYKQIRELIRKHAPELEDRYAHIVPKLAEIYTQLGLTSDALSAYDEVATRLQKTGRDREAIDIFRKMVELDMANPLPHLRLAEACCRVQDLDSAIESFWAAAELLLGLERRDDALKVIERILHFRQDPRFARVAAELYLQRNTREAGLQAIAKLQISFQADPKDLDTLSLLAQAFGVIGDDDKALEVHKEMARIAREQGNRELFEQLLAHLVAVAPDDDGVKALQSVPPPGQASSSSGTDDQAVSLSGDVLQSLHAGRPSFGSRPPLEERAPPEVAASAPPLIVGDDGFHGAEDLGAPPGFDSGAHTRKAIADADSFRKLRLFSKAIDVLRLALEVDPRSVEIRDKLCQVLQESGDVEGAIDETLTLAALYIDLGAPEHGQTLLYEVLQLAPDHATALQMLEQLAGGVPVEAPSWPQPEPAPGSYRERPGYDQAYLHGAPLPSFSDVDDPFGEVSAAGAQGYAAEGYPGTPLPAFQDGFAPEAPEPEAPAPPDEEYAAEQSPQEPEDAGGYEPVPVPAPAAEAPRAEAGGETIEDVLEEAEFFASRGLFDDARAILEDQLTRAPNHPLLLEQLQELDEARNAGKSGTIQRAQLAALAPGGPVDEDRAFDIAASLEALDGLEVSEPAATDGFGAPHDEVNVEQVFAKFKAGVRAQVSENDAATHYDLGVAYREMGLLPDAMHEFELAARDPDRECMCHAMIGMIHLESGAFDQAAASYVRGLEAAKKTVDQEMSLYYDLGNVKEMMGNGEEALYYFNKIARRDPGYRDVKDRIATLSSESKVPKPKPESEKEEEFDRVFDELFESK
jgi:tetratricopeptide (TPR) repeat protein